VNAVKKTVTIAFHVKSVAQKMNLVTILNAQNTTQCVKNWLPVLWKNEAMELIINAVVFLNGMSLIWSVQRLMKTSSVNQVANDWFKLLTFAAVQNQSVSQLNLNVQNVAL
jgi:hypothetical protein